MRPGRNGAGHSWTQRREVAVGRSHPERPLERLERNMNVPGELRRHIRKVEVKIFYLSFGKILRQQAGSQRAGIIEHRSPIEGKNAFVTNLQDVARFRTVHIDWPDD